MNNKTWLKVLLGVILGWLLAMLSLEWHGDPRYQDKLLDEIEARTDFIKEIQTLLSPIIHEKINKPSRTHKPTRSKVRKVPTE